MIKDVMLRISGLHSEAEATGTADDNEALEVLAPAEHHLKNGKHYLLYDEVNEETKTITKNKIKIEGGEKVEVIKTGTVNSHLVFEKGKMYMSNYDTPYGEIHVGAFTTDIQFREEEDLLYVKIIYTLEMNEEPVAVCHLEIEAVPRKEGKI